MNETITNLINMPTAGKLFHVLSFLTLLCAMMVVLSKRPVNSVLYLIATFFCLSAHYILLNAQFLAVVNIIVYAGAIMVLFLFVIMFLNLRKEDDDSKTNITKIAATIVAGMVGVFLVSIFRKAQIIGIDPSNFDSQVGMTERLGQVLYKDYLLPFELASILFLVAMVGAVMLGKREVGDRHY